MLEARREEGSLSEEGWLRDEREDIVGRDGEQWVVERVGGHFCGFECGRLDVSLNCLCESE